MASDSKKENSTAVDAQNLSGDRRDCLECVPSHEDLARSYREIAAYLSADGNWEGAAGYDELAMMHSRAAARLNGGAA